MAAPFTFPGVYIVEVPSGVRTITGVATSITAFVGRARRGPTDRPVTIQSFSDFERIFGPLWVESTLGYSVRDFYRNGGATAIIVRVVNAALASTADLGGGTSLEAANPGLWGDGLSATVDHDTIDPADTTLFNLTLRLGAATETFRNVSTDEAAPRYLENVLFQSSELARATGVGNARPGEATVNFTGGDDGNAITDAELTTGADMQANRQGLYLLENVDLFNILVVPPHDATNDVATTVITDAAAYCEQRRAFLLVDSPSTWNSIADAVAGMADPSANLGTNSRNAAAYFPRLRMPNPERDNLIEDFSSIGAVAGVMARTDATRGVWKAPAGQDAVLNGVPALSVSPTDPNIGELNPLGLNCLKTMAGVGRVVWGARTLQGADRLASEWRYIPIRRLTLFIEESLYRGTQWAVFEPNDEPLWSQLRLNVGAFMNNLFRQGAFQGSSPRDAYFVKCDRETTTQNDINLGIVNVLVGFAPLRPAEFVVIRIQQIAGEVEA